MTDNKASDSYNEYMARVGKEKIPCYEPTMGEEEIKFLTDVIKRNWLSENKYTREFEERLANICERKFAVAFCNATSAMIAGMKSLGIVEGDEVIVPSFSHPADPNCIAVIGAVPVFADVDEETLCLSPETIDAVKTDKTKAILLISLYGNTTDLDAISEYAKKNSLFIIHDCAPALKTTYKGKAATAYGDFTVLSFFADKTITTGEGGMLLTDNEELVSECNIYKHDGRKERGVDIIDRKGYNFRITELQSAVGVAQLNKLDDFVKKKKKILKSYEEKLSDIPDVKLFKFNDDADPVPHRVIIFVPEAASLIEHLEKQGIGVRTTFMPMHSQPCYDVKGDFQVTEKLFKTGVCLPSAPTLTEDNIEFICKAIKGFYSE
jgi:perosamine synthetase